MLFSVSSSIVIVFLTTLHDIVLFFFLGYSKSCSKNLLIRNRKISDGADNESISFATSLPLSFLVIDITINIM